MKTRPWQCKDISTVEVLRIAAEGSERSRRKTWQIPAYQVSPGGLLMRDEKRGVHEVVLYVDWTGWHLFQAVQEAYPKAPRCVIEAKLERLHRRGYLLGCSHGEGVRASQAGR